VVWDHEVVGSNPTAPTNLALNAVYYVYVLQSQVTGRFYTGSTADVADRLRHHNSGATPSTRHGIPWIVVRSEVLATKQEAGRRERFLKTGCGRRELKKLLDTLG
jgi:putative endonuclease